MTEEDLAPQREWLVSHIPSRFFPPGEVAAYSNYGAELAGCEEIQSVYLAEALQYRPKLMHSTM